MRRGFFQFAVACLVIMIISPVFAEPYVRIKPTDNQPPEAEVYEREVAPFARFTMDPVTPSDESCPAMLQSVTVQIVGLSAISPSVNQIVLALNKSKGVNSIEEERIIARGFYSGNDFIALYPVEGQNIIHFRDKIKMTVSVVMNNKLIDYAERELSCDVISAYATWVNGSAAAIRGFLPIIGDGKIIKNDASIGIINEVQASSYGALKYEVPEVSSEDVLIKKIFINGKRKDLKLLVETSDGNTRKFKCESNSEITVCDFDGEGLVIPKGSNVTITSSQQGTFYYTYDPINIFCEGIETGRRIFITSSYGNSKG